MFQNGTAWADGTSGVTQCPISPGNSFEYEFTATDQAGTFWYHSHRCACAIMLFHSVSNFDTISYAVL